MSLLWALPFAGLLLSIAIVPLISAKFWHDHYGKFSLFWSLVLVVPLALHVRHRRGLASGRPRDPARIHSVRRRAVRLVHVVGWNLHPRPRRRHAIAQHRAARRRRIARERDGHHRCVDAPDPAAARRQRRPHASRTRRRLLHPAGRQRRRRTLAARRSAAVHRLPQGRRLLLDHAELLVPTVALCVVLLLVFFLLDTYFIRREPPAVEAEVDARPVSHRRRGQPVIAGRIVGAVLMSGMWKPGIEVTIFGTPVALQALAREGLLIGLALVSLAITPRAVREHNTFHWGPIVEVAKLFAAIFVTIIPVLAMLQAGRNGALAPWCALVTGADGSPSNVEMFWVDGRAVGVPRQRADLPRVLQPGGRRPAGADGPLEASRSRRSRWAPSTSAPSPTSATPPTS